MSLKDKNSLYDLAGGYGDNSQPVSANDDSFKSTLSYYRDGGVIKGAPFVDKGGPTEDHMISLLDKKITSKIQNPDGTSNTYPSDAYYKPNAEDLDLEGIDGGQGYWHDIPNPGKHDGKRVKGKDLHVYLLENEYSYNHHTTTPQPTNVGPGDLDIPGIETNTPSVYTNPDNGQVYTIN